MIKPRPVYYWPNKAPIPDKLYRQCTECLCWFCETMWWHIIERNLICKDCLFGEKRIEVQDNHE